MYGIIRTLVERCTRPRTLNCVRGFLLRYRLVVRHRPLEASTVVRAHLPQLWSLPSGRRRQDVALNLVGSNPTDHQTTNKGIR